MIVLGPDFRLPPQMGLLQLVFLVLAIDALEREQLEYGEQLITLTSYYRDPMRNAEVGGVKNSLHQVGLALDFTSAPLGSVVGNVVNGIACGVGSIFGLCKERPLFSKLNAFRRIAPPLTQAVVESDHTHYELDLM